MEIYLVFTNKSPDDADSHPRFSHLYRNIICDIFTLFNLPVYRNRKMLFYFNLFADWVISFISVIHVLYIFCRATDK